MLALLGLFAWMLLATDTSQAQGFTITSTPTFASTNVGSTSAAANVVVTTTGTTTITGISVPNSVSGSPQFHYVSISGCSIGSATANATTCTISLTFSPAFPGLQTAPLIIAYTGGTFHVGLVGMGVAPQAILLPGVLSTVVNTAGVTGTQGQGDNGQATAAGLQAPRDISFDYAGNFYIGDIGNGAGMSSTAEIRKVTTSTGVISQFAGGGASTYSSSSSALAATSVGFNYATGVVFDSAGNAYIPDYFHSVVARVDAVTGYITAYAGQYGAVGNSGDGGLATAARLSGPAALAIDSVTGNLFIVDASNNDIREVNASTGIITTIVGVSGSNASCGNAAAGSCGDGGLATAAQLHEPNGIAVDASGNIYLADTADNRIRLVTKSTGIISSLAGTGTAGYTDGAAASAQFSTPFQIALDAAGDLYIADAGNNTVRVYMAATQTVGTVAGNGTACTAAPGSSCGDGGLSNVSALNGPTGVALDPFGNIYIVESNGNRVRKVTTNPIPLNTFPTEPIGTTYSMQNEALLNIGNATLTYATPVSPNSNALVTTTDPNAAASTSGAFAQTNATTCGPIYAATMTGTTLAPATPCIFALSFTPNTVAGNYTGTLVESDNSLYNTASIQTITLAGTGTKLTPTITLNSSGTPSYLGQSVTFTATVTSPNSTAVAPTGTVAFTYTTAAAPTVPVTITGSPITVSTSVAGVTTAVISTSTLPLGTDSVTAAYNGDGAYDAASSSAFAQVVQLVSGAADTVNAASTTTTVGTADHLTFAIPVIQGAAVPTGSVAFTAGATSLGNATWPATPLTGTCPSGTGTCYLLSLATAPTNIPLGSPTTVTATYTPAAASGYAAPATAPTIAVTVTLNADTITVTSPSSPDSVAYGSGTVPVVASSTSGQPITYATTTPGVCSVSTTGVVTILSTGTCTVTLDQLAAGNYAAAPEQTVTLNVGAGANTITFPALATTAIGATPPVPAATATSGVTPTYTSSTTSICTVTSSGVITDVAPGTCTIIASQGATGNYAAATSVSQSYQVTPLADTITVTSPASPDNVSFTSGGTVPIAASSTSGQSLTYATSSPACTVSSTGVITEVATGTCTVTVSQPAAGNYAAATSQTVTVNISAGVNTINFPALANTPAGSTAPALAATSTAGGTITYASTTLSVCTVSGGVITDVSPGTCTITANQGATGNYAAAGQQMQSYQVTPLADTITVTSPASPDNVSYTSGGTVPIAASSTSGQSLTYATSSSACTVSSTGVITEVATGSCVVTVSQLAAGNYAAATSQTVTVNIGAGVNTINFPALADTPAGATAPTPAATATSGVAPTYTSSTTSFCTVTSSGVITDVAPGTCTITASQGATGNYAAATSVSQSYQITPLADTITVTSPLSPDNVNYTSGGMVPIVASSTSGQPLTYSTASSSCTVSSTGMVSEVSTGICRVTISQPAAGNYAAATSQIVTVSIAAGTNTITFPALADTPAGAAAPTPAATATSGVAPTYTSQTTSICTVTSAGAITDLAPGTCTITAAQGVTGNYAAATSVSQSYQVTALPDTITVPGTISNPATVGGTFPIGATTSSGVTPTYTSTTPTICSVNATGVVTALAIGGCSVTVSQAAAGNYAAATSQTVTLTVNGQSQTIQNFGTAVTATYGGTAPILGATATSGLTPTYSATGTACSVTSAGAVTILAAGTCQLIASQVGNSTYAAATPVSETLTVNPAADVITIPGTLPTTATVGGAVPIDATTTSGVTPIYTSTTPATCSVSTAGVITALASGSCSVSVTQPAAGNYAAAAPQSVTIALNGQSQTIQDFGVAISATYGGAAPVLAATATSGLAPTYAATGIACSVTSSGTVTLLAVGTCQITASQTGNSTYAAATSVPESLTVNPEADVITIPGGVPSTATVGGTVSIGATTTSGVTPTYTSTTPTQCSVSAAGVITTLASGSCSVSVTQPAAGNFAAATPQTVTIASIGQSQTIQNFGTPITATYGGTAPVLAATATSGLTPTYASTGPACSVTGAGAVTILAVGSCQIAASQAGNSAYAAATPVTETLTVNPEADVITIPPTVPTTATVGSSTPIGATTTSGITPIYTSTTPAVCSVTSAGLITALSAGLCSVSVTQPAAGNFAAATPQTVALMVSTQSQTIQNFGTPITATFGGAAPVLAATATSGLATAYTSTGSACSVTSTGVVTILAAGTCQITASQAGNSTYTAATPVPETLTVNPAADVITIPPTVPTATTVGSNTPIGATTTSGVTPTYTSTTPAVCSVSATGVVTDLTSGSCSVTVSQAAAGNYAAATSQTVTITVNGQSQTIQDFGTNIATTYGSSAPILVATATSGLVPTYASTGSACSVTSAGSVTILAVGTCQIVASQLGNSTYAAATPVPETLTVNPAADVITIPPSVPSTATVGANVSIGATTTSGLPPTYTLTTPAFCSVSSIGVVTAIAIGTCSVTVTQPAAGNYAAATPQTVTLSVLGATNTIMFPALPNTAFTSVPPVPLATATSGQPVTYYTATAACSVTTSGVITFNSIGTCSITANQAAAGSYAAATPVTQSFLITPGVDAIVVPPNMPAIGAPGTTVSIGANSTSGFLITYISATPSVCTVTSPGGVVTGLTAGTCTITLSQPAAGNFAAAPNQTVTLNLYDFTITANSPTIQTVVPGNVVVYTYALAPLGGQYPGTNVTYTVTGLPSGATYTLTPVSGTVAQVSGPQTLTLTITTAQVQAMNRLRQTAPWTLALLLPFLLRRKHRRRLAQSLMMLLLLGVAAFTVTGCAAPNGFFGQPVANYLITVTATSGSVTHSAALVNLQVQ